MSWMWNASTIPYRSMPSNSISSGSRSVHSSPLGFMVTSSRGRKSIGIFEVFGLLGSSGLEGGFEGLQDLGFYERDREYG
jgi:hypothetical protein